MLQLSYKKQGNTMKILFEIITIKFPSLILSCFTIILFSFNLVAQETVTDYDGNVYSTISIGTQVWMKENLKTTRYNDGASIPNVTGTSAWFALSTPAYCWYDNNAAKYKATYGALYNWYAVKTGKLSPVGWHVPSDDEWTILVNYLGGDAVAGGKLKETGTTHWQSPNVGADNSSGFSAFGGGWRDCGNNGSFDGISIINDAGGYGMWWSSTEKDSSNSWYRSLGSYITSIAHANYKMIQGISVRCLKNVSTEVSDPKNKIQIPQKIKLHQNYPNPFNPSTKIEYSIPANSIVELKIFDTFGREVETLVNKQQMMGTYSLQWVPRNLTSGVYFYRIRAGKFYDTKKMMYVR